MALGFGSGRALWKLIDDIAARWAGEPPPFRAAIASKRTERRVRAAGIEVVELDGELRLDLAVDGADEIDSRLGLIKGGGAALLREKLVVAAAERFLVVAETAKRVSRLGETRPLPVEVVRFAWPQTRRRLLELVPAATLRTTGAGRPAVTDEGNHVLDCELPRRGDLAELAGRIKGTLGVVEHGLFLGMASTALLGGPDGSVEVVEARSAA